MNPLLLQGAALVLMLLALPLASVGTTQDAVWANVAAVAVLTVGGLIPPVLRYVGDDDDGDGGDDDGTEDEDAGPDEEEDA